LLFRLLPITAVIALSGVGICIVGTIGLFRFAFPRPTLKTSA